MRRHWKGQYVWRIPWVGIGVFDYWNGFQDAKAGHVNSLIFMTLIGTWMIMYAVIPERILACATYLLKPPVTWAVKGIMFLARNITSVYQHAIRDPCTRLSDRCGFYGKALRFRATARRWRRKIRRS